MQSTLSKEEERGPWPVAGWLWPQHILASPNPRGIFHAANRPLRAFEPRNPPFRGRHLRNPLAAATGAVDANSRRWTPFPADPLQLFVQQRIRPKTPSVQDLAPTTTSDVNTRTFRDKAPDKLKTYTTSLKQPDASPGIILEPRTAALSALVHH